jgi:hypothetical protein
MFKPKILYLALALATGLLVSAAQQARADFSNDTWTGTGMVGGPPNNVSGSAKVRFDFTFDSVSQTGTLTVTLTNTATTTTTDPGAMLTGLYFNLSTTLTPSSASLTAGSVLVGNTTDKFGATQVGQGWAYANSGVVPPTGDNLNPANTSIVGAGFGSPGGNGNFASPGVMLNGVAWGIVPSGNGVPTGGTNNQPVVSDSITFVLTSTTNISASDITGVEFAYGTGNSEGGFLGNTGTTSGTTSGTTTATGTAGGGQSGGGMSAVPVPPSALLLGIGGLGMAVTWFNRRRQVAVA